MKLAELIRKRESGKFATATVATFATQPSSDAATVAKVARVAVATPRNAESASHRASNNAPEELEVLAWLESIGEDDPVVFQETLAKCRVNRDALRFFLGLARGEEAGAIH